MPETKRSQRLFEVDQVPGQWAMLRIFGIKLLLPLRQAPGTPCLEVCGWRPRCRITQYNFRTHKRNQEFVSEPIYVNDPMEDARMWPHHPSPLEFEIATVAVCRTKRYNFQCVPIIKTTSLRPGSDPRNGPLRYRAAPGAASSFPHS